MPKFAPLPREHRRTSALVFDGASTTFGPFNFLIFDKVDVFAEVREGANQPWTVVPVTVQLLGDLPCTFYVIFDQLYPSGQQYRVGSLRVHERSVGVAKGNGLSLGALEAELSKQGSVLQELRRDIDEGVSRALAAPDDLPGSMALPLQLTVQGGLLRLMKMGSQL